MPTLVPAIPDPVWRKLDGVPIAVSAPLTASEQTGSGPALATYGEEFVVYAMRVKRDLITGITTFSGNVRILYGPTVITADSLDISEKEQTGRAIGKIVVTDPEGSVVAEELQVSFRRGEESASFARLTANVAGATIAANHAVLTKGRWEFEGIQGTTSRDNPPVFSVSGSRLTIIPGTRGTVQRPSISLFGRKVLTVPKYSFNLDKRVPGIGLPSISYRQDQGLGITWEAAVLLGPQTALGAGFAAFNHSYPSFGVQISRSYIGKEGTDASIVPKDELSQRFSYSWFENAQADRPESESDYLARPRSTVGIGSQWNRGTSRVSGDRFSKALDVAYEYSGQFGSWMGLGQARAQSISRQGNPFVNRTILLGSLSHSPQVIGENLSLHERLEFAGYVGGSNFGWARGGVGVAYTPRKELTFGVFGMLGSNRGTPDFQADVLENPDGINFRADLNLKATTIRYLVRLDPTEGWFDRQLYISQAIGCFEVFVFSRKVPREYRLGVKLRVDQFVDLLTRRKFERTVPVDSVASRPVPFPNSQ